MKKWFACKSQLEINLERIAPNSRAMILAYDQGVEHGPRDFEDNPDAADFEYILNLAKEGCFTGLVVHAGIARKYHSQIRNSKVPLILKLNGKSELYAGEPYSPQLYSVEEAAYLGAMAVGYTVFPGSEYEHLMNQEFTKIVQEAHHYNILAIGWTYPRGKSLMLSKEEGGSPTSDKALREMKESQGKLKIDETASMVAYAARLGMELGADMVKVKYSGSIESFSLAVKYAKPTKVVMSGGPKAESEEAFLNQVGEVLAAGGTGVAVGRNVWQRKNPLEISRKLREIIFK